MRIGFFVYGLEIGIDNATDNRYHSIHKRNDNHYQVNGTFNCIGLQQQEPVFNQL